MNERIKELAKQAEEWGIHNEEPYEDPGFQGLFIEKFAELIIQECLGVIENRRKLGPYEICREECKAVGAEIKHHFGVE